MAPLQFRLLERVLRDAGLKVHVVPRVTKEMIDWALSHVHNDMCYPALLSIGQVCYAALSGKYGSPDEIAIVMTQTGGGCRASQYVGFIKKAMKDNGYPDIPVIPLAFAPIKGDKWNQLGVKVRDVKRAMYAFLLGDLLMVLSNKVRPYEQTAGQVDEMANDFLDTICAQGFLGMNDRLFTEWVQQITEAFGRVEKKDPLNSKPKIGVVGEILLKYHPDGNNQLVKLIEAHGCEAVVSPLIDFFLYCLSGPVFQSGALGRSKLKAGLTRVLINYVEKRKAMVNEVLQSGFPDLAWPTIWELSKKTEGVIPLENSMGEGWLLPAEIVDLVEHGAPHVVIAQPFACLPNHQIGAGTVKTLSDKFPGAEIVSVNYDPGVSPTNQENRIGLLVANAKEYHSKTNLTRRRET
jgi:predicted nucleotide-binding protein (sugar kinase/HSP70/actin superfamily)